MSFSTIITWLVLLAIFSWCLYWHIQENRQIANKWKETLDDKQSMWLTRFAWSRSIQLILSLCVCFLIIIFLCVKLDIAKDKISELTARKPLPVGTQPPAAAAAQAPQYYPPESTKPSAVPQPPPMAATEQPPVAPAQKAPSVSDIYTPEDNDSQSAMDGLKQRYEDMLVIHFFLDRCGKVDKNDYYIIMAALSHEMASVNAPGRMQNDVLTAAQGSYNEMYAKSPCDSVDLSALITQYTTYIKALSQFSKR